MGVDGGILNILEVVDDKFLGPCFILSFVKMLLLASCSERDSVAII